MVSTKEHMYLVRQCHCQRGCRVEGLLNRHRRRPSGRCCRSHQQRACSRRVVTCVPASQHLLSHSVLCSGWDICPADAAASTPRCRRGEALTLAKFVELHQEQVGGLRFPRSLSREDVRWEPRQPPGPTQRRRQNRASTRGEETQGTTRPCWCHLSQ